MEDVQAIYAVLLAKGYQILLSSADRLSRIRNAFLSNQPLCDECRAAAQSRARSPDSSCRCRSGSERRRSCSAPPTGASRCRGATHGS